MYTLQFGLLLSNPNDSRLTGQITVPVRMEMMHRHLVVVVVGLSYLLKMSVCVATCLERSVNQNFLLFFEQIRQEKPYYIADPEVDSLVSNIIPIHLLIVSLFCATLFTVILFK